MAKAGRKKLPKADKVVSNPVYLRPAQKELIINEHGSLKNWVAFEVLRLQKKLSKKVA